MPKVPKGLYGPNRDGLQDPERLTVEERNTRPTAALAEEHARRTSPDVTVRTLQKAYDEAMGRTGR